jgi:hypothetical protein
MQSAEEAPTNPDQEINRRRKLKRIKLRRGQRYIIHDLGNQDIQMNSISSQGIYGRGSSSARYSGSIVSD